MSNRKYKIGIPGWMIKGTFGVSKSYAGFIRKFGEMIVLDPDHEIRIDLNCIVLPGGADVDTRRYGQAPDVLTGNPDIFKEYFDTVHLPKYIEMGVPIFGICRGMQSLWVHFGGKLSQDMMLDREIYDHPTNELDDPCSPMHIASVDDDVLSMRFNDGKNFIHVNSRHHQVVDDTRDIPECLQIISRETENQTVEAFMHKELPIVAFQHHPEDCYTHLTYKIFADLIENKGTNLRR